MKTKIFAIVTSLALILPASVGAVTAAELQAQIDALLAQLATLQAQLTTLQAAPSVTGCTITSFDRNLSQGMTGDDVKCLQITLNSAADTQVAASGVGSSGNETTYFGPLTKAAVVKFQEKYASEVLASWGLTSGTGYVGSTTRTKLNTMLGAVPPGCDCTAWVAGSCVGTDRQYTRTCTPAACAAETKSEADATCVVTTAAGLSVALASDTPAAAAIVSDDGATSGTGGGQALVPMLKLNLTASSEGDAKVTILKLKRGGISADSDIANLYLVDGSDVIAEMTSISSGVITFSDSAGLFTVSAGSTKAITVKMDLGKATSSGKTVKLSLLVATDVTSTASAVNGTFPIDGNTMSTASVSDLGEIDVANQTTPASVNAGESNRELWQIKLTGTNQKLRIEKLVLEMIGTADPTAITNVKLVVGGTQFGSTIESIPSSKILTFDLTSSPIEMTSGQVKYLSIQGDVVSGANRNFYFSIKKSYNLLVYDIQYNCYLKPNQENSFSTVNGDSNTSTTAIDATSINAATLTVSRSSDSPYAKIAADGLNVEVARFDFKATGEAVKVSTLTVGVDTDDNEGLDDVALYVDGSQIGTTGDIPAGATYTDALEKAGVAYSFGNAFIIPAGTTKNLVVKANIKNAAEASFTDADTLQIQLVAGTNNAVGQSSSTNISTPAVNANTLTVSSGTVVIRKNQSVAEGSATVPTGVKGATDLKLASFIIEAPAGEAVDVTQIVIGDELDATIATADSSLYDSLYNLKICNGVCTTGQIGSTVGTLTDTAGTDYTFTPSSAIRINKGAQYVVDIYADVLSSGEVTNLNADTTDGAIESVSVTATGVTTGAAASDTDTTDVVLQDIYIATSANLLITKDGATPTTQTLTTGSKDVTLAKFQFEADDAEAVNVTKIVISDYATAGSATSDASVIGGLANVRLYADDTQIGSASYSCNTTSPIAGTTCYRVFDGLTWNIPKGGNKVLTVKADLSTGSTHSKTTHKLSIEDAYTGTSEGVEATGASSSGSITGAQLDFSANTDADVDANTMRVYRAAIAVAKVAGAVDTKAIPSEHAVGVFTISNTSPEGKQVTISDIDVYPMSTNISLASGTTRNIRVYLGTATTADNLKETDAYLAADATTEWSDFSGTPSTEPALTSFTIGAGSSVTITITADNSDATTGTTPDSFQMKFAAGTDSDSDGLANTAGGISWSDGTTSNIYDVDSFPLLGVGISY